MERENPIILPKIPLAQREPFQYTDFLFNPTTRHLADAYHPGTPGNIFSFP